MRTLDYVYDNGTAGNLRDYKVPPREEGVSYGPAKPTPVPMEVGLVNAANRDFPHRVVPLGVLAFGAGYLF